MRKKNCVNCGAPIDPELIKCPYCGTCHIDFSAIDITDKTPVYLTYRTLMNNKPILLTQLAIPDICEVSYETETTDIVNHYGECIKKIASTPKVTTHIAFHGIPMSDGTLYKIQCE